MPAPSPPLAPVSPAAHSERATTPAQTCTATSTNMYCNTRAMTPGQTCTATRVPRLQLKHVLQLTHMYSSSNMYCNKRATTPAQTCTATHTHMYSSSNMYCNKRATTPAQTCTATSAPRLQLKHVLQQAHHDSSSNMYCNKHTCTLAQTCTATHTHALQHTHMYTHSAAQSIAPLIHSNTQTHARVCNDTDTAVGIDDTGISLPIPIRGIADMTISFSVS